MTDDLIRRVSDSVGYIRKISDFSPSIGVILGSGLGSFGEQVKAHASIDYKDIPFFGKPSVEGHRGRLVMGTVEGQNVAAMQGRLHYYEGYTLQEVVHPTRVLKMLGVKILIVTNAAGSLDRKMKPGNLMVIKDHINLMGDHPLRGKNIDQWGPRFPDMSQAYDKQLISVAQKTARQLRIKLHSGVYGGLSGPSYETPSEIKYMGRIGVQAVGMSTVPEVIAAVHMGLRVFGISCISNLAAGLTKQKLSHDEVTETTARVERQFVKLLTQIVKNFGGCSSESH